MLFAACTILSCAFVRHAVFNNWSCKDGLDTMTIVLQWESMRAHNLHRMESGAFVAEICCAWRAHEIWSRIFCCLAFLAAVWSGKSFRALAQCWNKHLAEFARNNNGLDFRFSNAVLSLKLSILANLARWLSGDSLACRLNDVFFHSCWAFLVATFRWANVGLLRRRAIVSLLTDTTMAF